MIFQGPNLTSGHRRTGSTLGSHGSIRRDCDPVLFQTAGQDSGVGAVLAASMKSFYTQGMLSFLSTELSGVVIIEMEPLQDDRGFFGRSFCQREFSEHGLQFTPVQSSISFNVLRGTLRGLHYQAPPQAEAKLVRCTMGAAYDVAADVRPESATFGKWVGLELSATNRRSLFIPKGVAHGFQTLVDDTEISYMMSEFYSHDSQRGIRWNDPIIGVDWPSPGAMVISKRDGDLPHLLAKEPP